MRARFPILGYKMHWVALGLMMAAVLVGMLITLLPRYNRGDASGTASCLPQVLAANEDAAKQLSQPHQYIRDHLAPHALARKLRAAASLCGSPQASPSPSPQSGTPTPIPSPVLSPSPSPGPTTSPSPTATPTPGPTSTIPTLHGIFQVFGAPQPNNKALDGMVLTYPWSQLEPQEGVFDFVQVEKDIAPWAANNKRIIIRVQTMVPNRTPPATPQWVFDAMVQANPGAVNFLDTSGTRAPVYWQAEYQVKLADFATELARRYDGDPRIAGIQGGIGVYSESKPDKLEPGNALTAKWESIGYTDALWETTLHQLVNIWRSTFVSTRIISSVDRTYVEPNSGFTEASYISWLRQNNVLPQNDGWRASNLVTSKWTDGPHIEEQYLDSAQTGSTVQADLEGMIHVKNVFYVLLYGADVIKGPQSVLDGAAAQVGAN